jgi:hypothetical protein
MSLSVELCEVVADGVEEQRKGAGVLGVSGESALAAAEGLHYLDYDFSFSESVKIFERHLKRSLEVGEYVTDLA